jgi:hypothetical protein
VKDPSTKESKKAEKKQLKNANLESWLDNPDDRPVYCLRYGNNSSTGS